MPIAEWEMCPQTTGHEDIGALLPAPDPMDLLIEDLRGEFRRGLDRQVAEKEAAKRKRLVALTVLIAPVGLILTAAMVGRAAAHHRVEANRQETRYGQ
jgi:hypothetical protein